MKFALHSFFLVLLLLIIAGCGVVNQSNPVASIWTPLAINAKSIGDTTVSIAFNQPSQMEAKLNSGNWVAADLSGGIAYFDISTNAFVTGSNALQVRVVEGSETGSISSFTIWRGNYTQPGGSPSTNTFRIQADGSIANDALVKLKANGATEAETIYALPDNDGNFTFTGLPAHSKLRGLAEGYEHFVIDPYIPLIVNYRSIVANTQLSGKLQKRTNSGLEPFTSADGEVWLHPHYLENGKYFGAQDMHTSNGNGDHWRLTGTAGNYNDQSADYVIQGLAGGSYQVLFFWLANNIHNVASAYFTITPGSTKTMDFTFDARVGVVTGNIKDSFGNPTTNMQIMLSKAMTFDGVIVTYNTPVTQNELDGSFQIEAFYGTYTIGVSPTYPFTSIDDAVVDSTITISGVTTSVQLQLP